MDDKFEQDVDECLESFNQYASTIPLSEEDKQKALMITIVQSIGKKIFLRLVKEQQ